MLETVALLKLDPLVLAFVKRLSTIRASENSAFLKSAPQKSEKEIVVRLKFELAALPPTNDRYLICASEKFTLPKLASFILTFTRVADLKFELLSLAEFRKVPSIVAPSKLAKVSLDFCILELMSWAKLKFALEPLASYSRAPVRFAPIKVALLN